MAAKKQLTKTEKLGLRLQISLLIGLVLGGIIFIFLLISTTSKTDNMRMVNALGIFAAIYLILMSIIGLKTKVIFSGGGGWDWDFTLAYGKSAKIHSIVRLIAGFILLIVFLFLRFSILKP